MSTSSPDGTNAAVERSIVKVDRPMIERGYAELHRKRRLVGSGNSAQTDPFLLMVEDWTPRGVFEPHPHRGMETVTYVLEGHIHHDDNHGAQGSIGPREALWLTAGRGVVHNEIPGEGEVAHILQLWVNLPGANKMVASRVQVLTDDQVPRRIENGVTARVFSGSSGATRAATRNYAEVTLVELEMEVGARFGQDLPAGYNAFVVVLSGAGTIGAAMDSVQGGDIAWLSRSDERSTVSFSAEPGGMTALLVAGLPLREPVAARGPFVMNTENELAQAYADFRAQREKFGT